MTDSLSILTGALSAGEVDVVDLSATITTSPPEVPEWQRTDIVYSDHSVGAAEMHQLFGVPAELLRNQEGPATEYFARLVTHNTTHVDAPRHYNSEIQGRPARSIDALPLSWFIGAGVVVNMTGRDDGDAVTETELRDALKRQSHALAPGEIVLVRTGCDRFYGLPEYAAHGPGVSPEATVWLYEQGIRVMGIDAWGWDAPVALQAARALAANRGGIFWGAHQIDREYAQIERMVNLGSLPSDGFLVICLPLKVADGSAGPVRAVALVPRTMTKYQHETLDMIAKTA
jgi:kynurenine formamidase